MCDNSSERRRRKPGEKVAEKIWLSAIATRGQLPTPTVDRVKAIKLLVSSWEDIDEA